MAKEVATYEGNKRVYPISTRRYHISGNLINIQSTDKTTLLAAQAVAYDGTPLLFIYDTTAATLGSNTYLGYLDDAAAGLQISGMQTDSAWQMPFSFTELTKAQ